jgi:hypothetical protein
MSRTVESPRGELEQRRRCGTAIASVSRLTGNACDGLDDAGAGVDFADRGGNCVGDVYVIAIVDGETRRAWQVGGSGRSARR